MVTEIELEQGLEILTEGSKAQITRPGATEFSIESVGDETLLEQADEVRDKTRGWTHGRGIEGLGIGDKLTDGKPVGELALRVYVQKKKPKSKVSNPIPKTVAVPGVGDLSTDVIEVGRITPEMYTERLRPALPGCGISHHNATVGTLGCLVRQRGDTDHLFLLSNSHVIANAGLGQIGDVILQPGKTDGGTIDDDSIAKLSDFVPFKFTETGFPNLVDAAIAKVNRRTSVKPTFRVLNFTPDGVGRTLRRGMHVKKVGRTTDYTTGVITDVHFRLALRYQRPGSSSKGRVGFRDQILCTRYSAQGDSGSIILNSRNKVIGLHFAGSPSVSIFNRIAYVFDLLGLELA